MADVEKVIGSMISKRVRIINRTQETKNIIIRAGSIATIFLILLYGAFLLSKSVGGNLEVTTGNGDAAISICQTRGFENPSDIITVPFCEDFNNISYTWLPFNTIGLVDGPMNGQNYMCFTFYIRNESKSTIEYTRTLKIGNIGNDLDQCLRVMMIRNDTEITYYAKAKEGTDNEPEDLYYLDSHISPTDYEQITTIPFQGKNAIDDIVRGVPTKSIEKYTIVIWIEGSDQECVDEKLAGYVNFKMDFKAYLDGTLEGERE